MKRGVVSCCRHLSYIINYVVNCLEHWSILFICELQWHLAAQLIVWLLTSWKVWWVIFECSAWTWIWTLCFFLPLPSNSTEQNIFWGANKSSASQEISPILRNLQIYYHICRSPSPVPVMSQINSVYVPSHFLKIIIGIQLTTDKEG
jgi:hypothetical protein